MREANDRRRAGQEFTRRIRVTRGAERGFVPVACFAVLCICAIFESACAGVTKSTSSPPPPPNVVVTVTPATPSVPTSGAQVFTATVTGSDGGSTGTASTNVTWSVNNAPGGNSTVGTIVATGTSTAMYTAPAAVPSPAIVTVTATSTVDASASGSASVTITCTATNSISPPSANLGLGQPQSFTASFCLAAGASVAWDVNGIANGNSSVGTIHTTGSESMVYTAPAGVPSTTVTIHATASAVTGGATAESATVAITSDITVSVAPPAATVPTGQRLSFAASVANASDTTVTWAVNGVANGNASVGQVCVSGTNPCVAPAGPASGSIDYLAPAAVPSSNPVTLVATSHADPSRTGVSAITITASSGIVGIAIAPTYAFVPASGGSASTWQFFASVTGTPNTSVAWSVESGVSGQGCAGSACGSVNASGLYSAPAAAPSPNAISVVATSAADPSKSASATIAITSGPTIEVILPSSVMAGAVESFPLSVQGASFVAGSGSSASTILINGIARSTTCASTSTCTTVLNPSDVASAGTLTVQVQNPGSPSPLSNLAPFVVAPFDVSAGTIALTSGQPAAAGNNIVIVEPTTAAASSPIDVDFIGFLTGGNTCGVQGSPLTVTRPSSGSTTVSICVHGTGLDPTFTYAFTGPSSAPNSSDIGVTASAVTGLFPNMIELDLQITSTTLAGVRSLFITTPNNDRAVATGMLEVN